MKIRFKYIEIMTYLDKPLNLDLQITFLDQSTTTKKKKVVTKKTKPKENKKDNDSTLNITQRSILGEE